MGIIIFHSIWSSLSSSKQLKHFYFVIKFKINKIKSVIVPINVFIGGAAGLSIFNSRTLHFRKQNTKEDLWMREVENKVK